MIRRGEVLVFRPFRPGSLCGKGFLGLRAWRFTPGYHILGFQPTSEKSSGRRVTESGERRGESGSGDGGRREAVMRCFGPSVFRCGTTPSLGCLFH